MSEALRKSVWDNLEEKKSSPSSHSQASDKLMWKPLFIGITIGALCGGIALATVITLWITSELTIICKYYSLHYA
jgi:Mg/Co/Ni transporter MgtE